MEAARKAPPRDPSGSAGTEDLGAVQGSDDAHRHGPAGPGGRNDSTVDAASGPARVLQYGNSPLVMCTPRWTPHGAACLRIGARTALDRYGPNEMPRTRRRPLWRQLGAQFTDLFAVVLLVASAITFLAYGLEEPRDVWHSATRRGDPGRRGAERRHRLRSGVLGGADGSGAGGDGAPRLPLLRGGERLQAPARGRGAGRRRGAGGRRLAAPADCPGGPNTRAGREQRAADRGRATPWAAPPIRWRPERRWEARNCVFMGTDVVAGAGRAVVFASGAATELGRIYRLAAAVPRQKTPVKLQVASMARRVAGAALAIGALMFAVRLPTGESVVTLFVFALGVMVALVPEGLPATLSVSRRSGYGGWHAVTRSIKQLLAVEALGSTTVVCTDKDRDAHPGGDRRHPRVGGRRAHPVSGVGSRPSGEVADATAARSCCGWRACAVTPAWFRPPAPGSAGRCSATPRRGRC